MRGQGGVGGGGYQTPTPVPTPSYNLRGSLPRAPAPPWPEDEDDDDGLDIRLPATERKLVLAKLPQDMSTYSSWRLGVLIELMGYMPIESDAVMLFIEELDTLSFTGVDEHRLPAPLRLYDGRFYAALVLSLIHI